MSASMLDFNVTQAYDTSSPQLVASEPIDYYMHIRYKPHERVALSMLKEIARLVRPIMVRHKYKLESLSEFLPDDRESLLGQHGSHRDGAHCIYLRLREFHDHSLFLALEDCVHLMLHELAHVVHSGHTEAFWTLFQEHLEEYRANYRSGSAGSGPYAGSQFMKRSTPFNSLGSSMNCGVEREPGESRDMEMAAHEELKLRGYLALAGDEERRSLLASVGGFVQRVFARE